MSKPRFGPPAQLTRCSAAATAVTVACTNPASNSAAISGRGWRAADPNPNGSATVRGRSTNQSSCETRVTATRSPTSARRAISASRPATPPPTITTRPEMKLWPSLMAPRLLIRLRRGSTVRLLPAGVVKPLWTMVGLDTDGAATVTASWLARAGRRKRDSRPVGRLLDLPEPGDVLDEAARVCCQPALTPVEATGAGHCRRRDRLTAVGRGHVPRVGVGAGRTEPRRRFRPPRRS